MNRDLLRAELIRDEDLRTKPYLDCCGKYWRDCACATKGKLTIGIGRNLDDIGISKSEAMALSDGDIQRTADALDKALPWWRSLDDVRQRVMLNMAFNLGVQGLLGFRNTLIAIKAGAYDDAAERMLDSLWAKQVGARAVRLASMMQTGQV